MIGKEVAINATDEHNDLLNDEPYQRNKANEEHETTHQTEDMHWFLTEISEEPKRQKVEITIKETVDSKLRFAIFACLMVHYFLTDTPESCLFGKVRDVTVHLSVHLNVLYNITPIGF